MNQAFEKSEPAYFDKLGMECVHLLIDIGNVVLIISGRITDSRVSPKESELDLLIGIGSHLYRLGKVKCLV